MNAEHQQLFSLALTTPDHAPVQLFSNDLDEAAERFDIYRNNVRSARVTALRKTFPVLERFLGEDYFAAAAALFVSTQPPTSAALHEYGDGFGEFLLQLPALVSMPWLGEVAQIERARVRAFHAANRLPFALDTSAGDVERQLTVPLIWHPSLTLIRASSPAFALWDSQVNDRLPPSADRWQPENVLIWRQGFELRTESLPVVQCDLLELFKSGRSLNQVAAMSPHGPTEAAAQLGPLITQGCLCRAEVKP
ncbi:DNA-binding domain-containing protein [Halopseudomonas sp.]|uniref:DNA-binding domain-containing protein n=1 Tax=Halopseudomonas sp. TaxID=2901191 RepID=UPI00311FEBD0